MFGFRFGLNPQTKYEIRFVVFKNPIRFEPNKPKTNIYISPYIFYSQSPKAQSPQKKPNALISIFVHIFAVAACTLSATPFLQHLHSSIAATIELIHKKLNHAGSCSSRLHAGSGSSRLHAFSRSRSRSRSWSRSRSRSRSLKRSRSKSIERAVSKSPSKSRSASPVKPPRCGKAGKTTWQTSGSGDDFPRHEGSNYKIISRPFIARLSRFTDSKRGPNQVDEDDSDEEDD
ncbi:hypothetical protein QVD17_10390 [Tagetes erecta]|uniref:Uncharacterized protein n=1 Tax=Tagetes erecta TaxID=13708 RepID=A0AAD8L975_TARER|nr:hypothetical protein QVD17_10390 [Tagetes erecta]